MVLSLLKLEAVCSRGCSCGECDEVCRRIRKEDEVRVLKRKNMECPYKNLDGICEEPKIRCGERQLLSVSDSGGVARCRCNYDPEDSKKEFLIVEDEDGIVDFITDFLTNFMGIYQKRISKASSVQEAKDVLRRGKIHNKQYCLVISDIRMPPGDSGYHLVNHVIERNYNTRIILMSGHCDEGDKPLNYLGDSEIMPSQKAVSAFLIKPIKIQDLKAHVKSALESYHASN